VLTRLRTLRWPGRMRIFSANSLREGTGGWGGVGFKMGKWVGVGVGGELGWPPKEGKR
jgi:hypothetical protein